MIVSWNWLQDLLPLHVSPDELARRLMMAGLNHESTQAVGDDLAIDLEVTSNRPDCLGHLGVAREAGVLMGTTLAVGEPQLTARGPAADQFVKVRIECPDLCDRYLARVIRGAKIGPSPRWLASRLETVGIAVINNVVDVSNYVLLECGQPLHVFDLDQVRGAEIIVREARLREPFLAIDHRRYELGPGVCVIADADRPVALGGVMGGADSEVSPVSTNLLIEAAEFSPMSIRSTARQLNLHSPSSYRFERGVDPAGVDWASRRCCELILDLAGGELAAGSVDVGRPVPARPAITLRLSQLPRVLGIDVPVAEVRRILAALGCRETNASGRGTAADRLEWVPPSWRRDLSREIDLVEEVARVHGYDQIPEDVAVPMAASQSSAAEQVLHRVRHVLTAAGCSETLTPSLVPVEWTTDLRPWTDAAPLAAQAPMKGILADAPKELGPADRMRGTLLPSLLEVRRYNESLANDSIELFEVAKVYLPRAGQLPAEPRTLAIVSSRDFLAVKGILEAVVRELNPRCRVTVQPASVAGLAAGRGAELFLGEMRWGVLGELSAAAMKTFRLRRAVTVAEVSLDTPLTIVDLQRQQQPISPYPPIDRDLNLIGDEAVRWADLEATVRLSGGPHLEQVLYRETYRDPAKDGPGKKRLLFSIRFRSAAGTLTNDEADRSRDQIVAACAARHQMRLLG